ncbi:hypothetical protein F4780DRAFT_98419 [Xylariomycetidae sp. FL0641]|nr:hypothetical protein F4780DRAFT_98419 [Xylariomycetidae sp. FL0641]
MAQSVTPAPAAQASPAAPPRDDLLKPPAVDEDSSPSDDAEEQLDVDQDDVQSMIQPALSPMATRLTSSHTPASEKAAALERAPNSGLLRVAEGSVTPVPDQPSPSTASGTQTPETPSTSTTKLQARHNRGLSMGQLPSSFPQVPRFPTPWQSGPKDIVVQNDQPPPKPALSGVFGPNRHRRSSSVGTEAIKKIKDALPSLTFPSFFSGPLSAKASEAEPKRSPLSGDGASESKQTATSPLPRSDRSSPTRSRSPKKATDPEALDKVDSVSRPPPPTAIRPRIVRRVTSDESILYHPMSRVSSLGDDDRWNGIREQKNSRLKAITDSWDRPTFKMPQLPNVIPASLKKHPMLSMGGVSDPSLASEERSSTLPELKDGNLSDFDRALESLTGDIVVMGGYRGSILRSTKTNRQVWVPVKVGLNIRKVNLEVGLDPEDEERMEENIYSSGMLQNIGPVDISRRLFKRLRDCENARTGKLRVWDYGYDWRLSPALLSRKLVAFLEKLPSNQNPDSIQDRGATVIAHSLGGLITRHAVNQRPDLFAGVVYAGTPQRCINILGPIRNGDAVLFNEKVLTAAVNFSLRTSFVFLPEDGFCFINKHTGEEYRVDFFDPLEWSRYSFSPCIEPPLPATSTRSSTALVGSFRDLSGKLPTPLRSRGNSEAQQQQTPPSPGHNMVAEAAKKVENATSQRDRTLAPQMGTLPGDQAPATTQHSQGQQQSLGTRSRNMAYLSRTLAATKQFRAETAFRPQLGRGNAGANLYPPAAVIYGKDTPTVYAARVSGRDAIAAADAYDDLVFRSGDGVVLAREAMLPDGYDVVKGGRVSTDRGHITMLGDLDAVGKALRAVLRGRRKGVGLGLGLPPGGGSGGGLGHRRMESDVKDGEAPEEVR